MKELLQNTRLWLCLMLMLCCASGAWAEEATLTFTQKCQGVGTDDKSNSWIITSDASESTYESARGIHYGTGSAAVSYITLTTSGISGTITKIVVNAAGASNTTGKLDVKVGGNAFGSQESLTSTATDYTFTGSASGSIEIKLSQTSAKRALYVKSVVVTYTTDAPSATETIPSVTAQPIGATYYKGAAATALSFVVSANPSPTYQWYTNTIDNNENGTEIPGATNSTYTPSTETIGDSYYYCVATNKLGSVTSDAVKITVRESLTLTYSVNGNTTVKAAGQYCEGEEVDLTAPTSNIPDGYVFMGWVASALDEAQQTAPTYVGNTMPAESTTYYAVFAIPYSEGGGYGGSGSKLFSYSDFQADGNGGWSCTKDPITVAQERGNVLTNYASLAEGKNLTISCAAGYKITEIDFTTTSSDYTGNLTDVTELSTTSWQLTVDNPGSNTTCQLTSVNVTYIDGTTYSDFCTSVNRLTPALSFASAEYWVSGGATIVSPVVSNDQSGAAVTYSTSDGNLATVDQDSGELLIIGTEGDVTITATVAPDANYNSASASYLLHIVAPEQVSVSAAHWATFAPDKTVELPAGVYENGDADGNPLIRIYYVAADAVDEQKISFTDAKAEIGRGGAIAAGTGILVKAQSGSYSFPVNTTATPTELANNQLVGVTAATPYEAADRAGAYLFSKGSNGIGFYEWHRGTLAANKCYLQLTATQQSAAPVFFGLPDDDEVTLIAASSAAQKRNGNAEKSYNLNGQRVDVRAYKGIVIINGKKNLR